MSPREAPLSSSRRTKHRQAADESKPKDWRSASSSKKRKKGVRSSPAPKRAAPAWQVTPDDLGCLDEVRSLLSALNDAYVSSSQIQELILKIPVLTARCIRRIGSEDYGNRTVLDRALTKIGNMGVEGELLGLLEDLTTCQADLREAEATGSQSPAATEERPSSPPG